MSDRRSLITCFCEISEGQEHLMLLFVVHTNQIIIMSVCLCVHHRQGTSGTGHIHIDT